MAKRSSPSQADDLAGAPAQSKGRTRTRREVAGATSAPDPQPIATASMSMGSEPSEEDIRLRAYQRYVARGRSDGAHFEDWLEAERELRKK